MDEQIGQLDRGDAAHWNRLTLPHLFERNDLQLSKTAIVFEDRTRTYGELRDAGRRVANALIGLGVEEFDRVAVLSSNRLEFIEIETGIAAARAIMVPLNWRLRPNELANLLRRSAARAILVEDRFLGTVLELRRSGEVPDLRSVISLDGGAADLSYDEIFSSSSPERPTRSRRMDDPHEIIFTSGTTGQPKGVVWTDGTRHLELAPAADRLPARARALHLRDHRPLLHRGPARLHLGDAPPGRHGPRQALERLRRRGGPLLRRAPRRDARAVGADDALRHPPPAEPGRARHQPAPDDHVRRPAGVDRDDGAGARGVPGDRLRAGLRPHRGRRGGDVHPAGRRPRASPARRAGRRRTSS